MKKNYKGILLIAIFFLPLLASSQSEEENILKYWLYRKRLQYFVIPGDGPGESQVASERNFYNAPILNYGQHDAYLSDYMGMLATEYYLLNQHSLDHDKTLMELYYALRAFIEKMDMCESKAPWDYLNMSDQYDGFFMRDNVPGNFITLHDSIVNKNMIPYDMGIGGTPGWVDTVYSMNTSQHPKSESMSQDEAIFLLQGLALVKKLVPDGLSFHDKNNNLITYNFSSVASQIAEKVILFIRDSHSIYGPWYCPSWIIFGPDGNTVPQGSVSSGFQYGFAYAFSYFSQTIPLSTFPGAKFIWNQTPSFLYLLSLFDMEYQSGPSHLSNSLAAIGNSWTITIGITLGSCPICVHVVINVPATALKIKLSTNRYDWDTFYLLLWEVLHNKSTPRLSLPEVYTQLSNAPCEGPYYRHDYDHSGNGWASSAKFWSTPDRQNNGNSEQGGVYNGLDYMLLYNLYHIINSGHCPPYENYNCRYLTGTVPNPKNYTAFDSLYSVQTIADTVPVVNYKAGKLICLKPGFNTLEGSDFHAFLGETACGTNIVNDTTSLYPDYPTEPEDTIITDTIPCMPAGYDTLHFNGLGYDTTGLYLYPDTLLYPFTVNEINSFFEQYSYEWFFPQPAIVIPNNTVQNPSVVLPDTVCDHLYRCSFTFTDTSGNGITVYFNLYKACCDTDSSKALWNLSEKNPLFKDYPFFVFPNPTTGLFTVRYSDINDMYMVEIFDITGSCIYRKENITGETEMDLSSEPKGVYFVKAVTANNKMFLRKLLVN